MNRSSLPIRTLGIGLAFFCAYLFNSKVFAFLALDDYASLVFIPAGLRLFFVVIYRWQAIPGLMLGSLVTSLWFGQFDTTALMLLTAIVSSMNAMITLLLYEKFSGSFDRQLQHLKFGDVVAMAITQALLGTMMHHLLYVTFGLLSTLSLWHFYAMFIGDVFGILVLMLATIILFKSFIRIPPGKA